MASLTEGDTSYYIRFGSLESIVRDDPDLVEDRDAIARLRGLSRGDYEKVVAELGDGVRRAAEELTADDPWRRRLVSLPWIGQTVVMVGDSITADFQSWARILESAITRQDVTRGTRIVNLGVDGDTSAGVLARLPAILACEPTHVVIMIGTNDGQGHARHTVAWLSDDETRRNLTAINATLTLGGAEVAWLAPPRIDVQGIRRHWYLGELPIQWSSARHEAKRRMVLEQPGFTFDTHSVVGDNKALFLDGLHPSLEGHKRIARELVDAIGSQGTR